MNFFSELTAEQVRQAIDAEQIYAAYEEARRLLASRFDGSMVWKTVGGRVYLYRKIGQKWKSLGPRTGDAEAAYKAFTEGRQATRERAAATARRLDEMAPVNRALRLGRLPRLSARVIRRLHETGWLGGRIQIVGTNALYAYERAAGVQIAGDYLATGDVDLLVDGRAKLKLAVADGQGEGILAMLTKVDKSFVRMGRSFRAVNRDGFMVDLITPAGRDPTRPSPHSPRAGEDDLQAAEIPGLAWLVNSPKFDAVAIGEDGYPVRMVCPDPRAFAIHKLWLSKKDDREPAKKGRDLMQARVVAEILRSRLPGLPMDAAALQGLPLALRNEVKALGENPPKPEDDAGTPTPKW